MLYVDCIAKAKKLDMDRFSISIVNWSIYYII